MTEVFVDQTTFTYSKRRRGDIKRHWRTRYNAFIAAGFTDEEARWAADNGLKLKDEQVREVIEMRKAFINFEMKYFGVSREEAVIRAAEKLREKLLKRGIDDPNVFYEVSP